MNRAEEYINENTRNDSNIFEGYYPNGKQAYFPWIHPKQAKKAVEIAREELIDKVIGWIKEINNHHHIIRYSDSCEPPISELTEWFKNYMKEVGKDE